MKRISVSLLLVFLVLFAHAQTNEDDANQLKQNNIGFGLGMAYMVNENEWAPGIHIHYARSLGEKQRFSIGSCVEYLFAYHQHASVALGLSYKLTKALSVGYSSGLEFHLDNSKGNVVYTGNNEENDVLLINSEENEVHLAHHIEISYEFDLDFIHIGPMVEYGFSNEDQHLMFGVHAGYSF